METKTRIAPTPSGLLHVGNALSFAVTWAIARHNKSKIVLRIDDLDNIRSRPEYLKDIFDTLDWMELDYDEGPKSTPDFLQHYSQQLRISEYNSLLEKLVGEKLVYACDCSRSQILQHSPNGIYPRTCLHKGIPLDSPNVAWRVKIDQEHKIYFQDLFLGAMAIDLGASMPDFVVRRKDGIPSYQIASLCDDINMKCNLIVRGKDLLHSTAAQLFLDQAIGNNTFSKSHFVHHPLITDSTGEKLSKSQESFALASWRKSGISPQKVWEAIFQLFKWEKATEPSRNLFLKLFTLSELSRLE